MERIVMSTNHGIVGDGETTCDGVSEEFSELTPASFYEGEMITGSSAFWNPAWEATGFDDPPCIGDDDGV